MHEFYNCKRDSRISNKGTTDRNDPLSLGVLVSYSNDSFSEQYKSSFYEKEIQK